MQHFWKSWLNFEAWNFPLKSWKCIWYSKHINFMNSITRSIQGKLINLIFHYLWSAVDAAWECQAHAWADVPPLITTHAVSWNMNLQRYPTIELMSLNYLWSEQKMRMNRPIVGYDIYDAIIAYCLRNLIAPTKLNLNHIAI